MKKLSMFGIALAVMLSLIIPVSVNVHAASGSMTAAVKSSTITVTVKNLGAGTVYGYETNQYHPNDPLKGLSTEITSTGSYTVGSYSGGTKTFTINRYDENGRDRLYCKYYLISSSNKIVKGPIYATSETSRKKKIAFKQKSKKGLSNENSTNMKYAKDLGASSITINLNLSQIMYANKPSDESNAIRFKSNGNTYYFSKSSINGYDNMISAATKNKMNVVAIIAAWSTENRTMFSDALRYPHGNSQMGTNTSNDQGRDEYIAMVEFLADRYSQGSQYGLISTYVVGNEIDYTSHFCTSHNLNQYMVEYERSLRITNLAVKKYAGDATVAIPLTHYWKGDSAKIGKECFDALRPYDMCNWLGKVTKQQGNYNWGLAYHCYSAYLTSSDPWRTDTHGGLISGNYKTSKIISFANLEILQGYLEQSSMKCGGKIRGVYLTESSISSFPGKKADYINQAGNMAAAYFKIANLSCVKTFNYYRLQDHPAEYKNGLRGGLLTLKGKKKPVYKLYKYLDTLDFTKYANEYLKSMNYYKNANKKNYVSYGTRKVQSYYDCMFAFTNRYKIRYYSSKALKSSLKKYDSGMPTSIKAIRGKRSISIRWKKSSKASGYRILVNGKSKGTTTKSSFTIKKLKRGKKYHITVQAYKKVKGKKYYGFRSMTPVWTK